MGCLLDGGDNLKIGKKYYALGQGLFCGMHAQKSTTFQSKPVKKSVRYEIFKIVK